MAIAGWDSLPVIIQGAVYYTYNFSVSDPNGNGSAAAMTVQAFGDLDGDGVLSHKFVLYQRVNGVYQTDESDTTCTWVCPPFGQEDTNPPTF
jgi:hypothetical protein